MVIKRSRKWVKDRIPAFLCRETGWWVARWIQCNVFLCPECRQEYRSLKKTWNELDNWEVEEPCESCEEQFLATFRETFPSATQASSPVENQTRGWMIPGFAYGGAVAVLALGLALLEYPLDAPQAPPALAPAQMAEAPPTQPAQPPAKEQPASPQEIAKASPVLHFGPNPALVMRETPATYTLQQGRTRLTSYGPGTSKRSRSKNLSGIGRTVEINNLRVDGFESLSAPYEAERPF